MARITLRRDNPRSPVKGTKYESTPALPPPPNSYSEIGSQITSAIREIVPELANRFQATQTYKKMMRSDASVRSSMRAGKAPILAADFFVEPFDDSEEAQVVAEFVKYNLFDSPSVPFVKTLADVLTMFDYGFSVLEPVYEMKEWAPKKTQPAANRKKYTMLRKVALRPAPTIAKFLYDENGGPAGVEQNATDNNNKTRKVTIPIEKLLIFTFDGEGGNLEGESILRSAYTHWFYKTTLYKIDAIQKERHGIGVPDIELQTGASQADTDLAHRMGRNLRTNEFSYIVRPPALKVGFAELQGNLVNALESAGHHDNMIMKNILVQFLNMGLEGGGGGRNTASSAFDMFLKSMSFAANYICDCYNMYLISRLVAYNFDTAKFPKLAVRNVGEMKDLQMWSSAFRNLVDVNIITNDLDTEQYARGIMDIPKKIGERPLAPDANVKQQYLLRDNPDTTANEDLVGEAALQQAAASVGRPPTGITGKSPSSGE